jgi:hypothetical protein
MDQHDIRLRCLREAGSLMARRRVADDLDTVADQEEANEVPVQGVAVGDDDPQGAVLRLLFPKQRGNTPRACEGRGLGLLRSPEYLERARKSPPPLRSAVWRPARFGGERLHGLLHQPSEVGVHGERVCLGPTFEH